MLNAIVRPLLRILFRFQHFGHEKIPNEGPALLICNHASWIDWLFLGATLDQDWKFVVSSLTADRTLAHKVVMRNNRTFPIDMDSPYGVRDMAKHLEEGGRLVLFAEGRITSTGSIMKFFEGTGFLLRKAPAKVVFAYLKDAHRAWWNDHSGWRRLFPKVSLHFAEPVTPPDVSHLSADPARSHLTDWALRSLIDLRFRVELETGGDSIPDRVARTAAVNPKQVVFEDVTRKTLTMRRLVLGARVLGAALGKRLDPNAQRVGLMLPSVNANPVALLALWGQGKTPALLNFTAGPSALRQSAELAELKQTISSRAFVEKAKLDLSPLEDAGVEVIYLEDVRETISKVDKIAGLLASKMSPASFIRQRMTWEDTAVVLFTSGSEGVPKGVELSHRNLLSNVEQILSVVAIQDDERIFNPLPLFHSFGLTIGTLLPMIRGIYAFLYPNPLSYKVIPTLVYKTRSTITMGSNTFLRNYARAAHPYDFHTLRYVFAGAEKLRDETFDLWSERFGVRILQGYGATETSPVVSVNTPLFPKKGSVGRLAPEVEVRFEPVPGVDDGGRLLVRGPNILKGYLNNDAQAKLAALDGWYDTGDIGRMDEEGYLYILGRIKRFAKVSGEMVSLTAVEDALSRSVETFGEEAEIAVVAVADAEKGERLVALTNREEVDLGFMRESIHQAGLSNLAVPRSVYVVAELPKLGTGKLDFPALKVVAEEKIG